MANLRERIKKELKHQQNAEGCTPDIALLFKVLEVAQTQQQWQHLVEVRHVRYGKLSYQTHRFYYPSKLLRGLEELFEREHRHV